MFITRVMAQATIGIRELDHGSPVRAAHTGTRSPWAVRSVHVGQCAFDYVTWHVTGLQSARHLADGLLNPKRSVGPRRPEHGDVARPFGPVRRAVEHGRSGVTLGDVPWRVMVQSRPQALVRRGATRGRGRCGRAGLVQAFSRRSSRTI